jgi:sugar lactone lactonase YvrE
MTTQTPADVRCVVRSADILGEVPLWCDRTQRLWWIDVRRPALQWYDPVSGRHEAIRLPETLLVGAIALRDAGGFVLATNSGLYTYDPDRPEAPELIVNPEADKPENRLNDGKCDRRGRFWVGSMNDKKREPAGTLYRLDADRRCHAMLDSFVLPNALSWSPDDRTMYFADTHNQVIWAFDFDIDDGAISNKRVFKDWTHQLGRPDGATVDVDGYLWNCMVATGELVRLAPDGRVDRVIKLPVTNPTCPAFGGAKRDVLYVTSHSQRLSPQAIAAEPYSGGLFALDVGTRGLPEARYAG